MTASAVRPGLGKRSLGSTASGATALTRMLRGPSSAARLATIWSTAARAAPTPRLLEWGRLPRATRATPAIHRAHCAHCAAVDHRSRRGSRKHPRSGQVHLQAAAPGVLGQVEERSVAGSGTRGAVEYTTPVEACEGVGDMREKRCNLWPSRLSMRCATTLPPRSAARSVISVTTASNVEAVAYPVSPLPTRSAQTRSAPASARSNAVACPIPGWSGDSRNQRYRTSLLGGQPLLVDAHPPIFAARAGGGLGQGRGRLSRRRRQNRPDPRWPSGRRRARLPRHRRRWQGS